MGGGGDEREGRSTSATKGDRCAQPGTLGSFPPGSPTHALEGSARRCAAGSTGARLLCPSRRPFLAGGGMCTLRGRRHAGAGGGRETKNSASNSAHRPLRPRTRAISVEEVEGLADLLLLLLGESTLPSLALVPGGGNWLSVAHGLSLVVGPERGRGEQQLSVAAYRTEYLADLL